MPVSSSNVQGEILRGVWRQQPNLVYSPLGVLNLLYLARSIAGAELVRSLEPGFLPVTALNSSNVSFRSSTTVYHSETSLPQTFLQLLETSRANTQADDKVPVHRLNLNNNNSININLGTLGSSEENFLTSSKTIRKIPMVVIRAEMRTIRTADAEMVEFVVGDTLSVQLLLPVSINGLGSVVDNIETLLLTLHQTSDRKPVQLRLPLIQLGGLKLMQSNSYSRAFLFTTGLQKPRFFVIWKS